MAVEHRAHSARRRSSTPSRPLIKVLFEELPEGTPGRQLQGSTHRSILFNSSVEIPAPPDLTPSERAESRGWHRSRGDQLNRPSRGGNNRQSDY
uniref:Uncharacterized protein n=1 Tax=Knipowitschia caucasica TaxID=637954 RepID=A0AAV2KZM3_KNICA